MPILVANQPRIHRIDVGALFDLDTAIAHSLDAAIIQEAQTSGVLLLAGLPRWVPIDAKSRRSLLKIFSLPEVEIRKLWRRNFDPQQRNIYRGWFPLQNGGATYKEGIDLGPDVAYGDAVIDDADPLTEATPLPPEALLPQWREQIRDYYRAMDRLSGVLMRSIARGLNIPEDAFERFFRHAISTLRLLHYPVRSSTSLCETDPRELWTEHAGQPRYLLGRAHVDTGFMTLLAQDGVAGLQVQHRDGSWADVPPEEGTLVVNFGKLFERWTTGKIRATMHRVLGTGAERYSIPFFYEAGARAIIAPLPLADAEQFAPFYYGDYLWDVTTQFIEQRGIAHLRQPAGPPPRNM